MPLVSAVQKRGTADSRSLAGPWAFTDIEW
jgi:hypothetical protein